MTKRTILLVFGAESPEHEISLMSARNIASAIDTLKYETELCYIDKSGKWWLVTDIPEDTSLATYGQAIVADMNRQVFRVEDRVIAPDCVVPVLHGPGGEEGVVAALCQLMHIPYVGCDMISSSVCWDKLYTKQLLESVGIPVAPYLALRRDEPLPTYQEVMSELGEPFFCKPTRAGSSVGVNKIHNADEYTEAVRDAFAYSDTILFEKNLSGRELEVAILGNPPHHTASGVGEILPGEEFYSYEDKYNEQSTAKVLTSPEIEPALAKNIRSMALQSYSQLGCRGLSRIDFLTDADGNPYLNEINTFPGFTNISQYPKLWAEQGISSTELIDELITLALGD